MKKDMIFAYYIMLSNHMWDDENSPARYWNMKPGYTPEIKFDEDVWDETMDFLRDHDYNMVVIDVGDGVKLDSHPEIAAPNAWSREHLQKKLKEIRDRGMEPIPKLNFSACHHTWLKQYRHMVSTGPYYETVKDVIDEVAELFGHPRLFHLGMDEENYANQVYRGIITIRNETIWWHDAYYLFDLCEKNGARPWVWSDYFWDHPEIFIRRMPKSVLQSNWFYSHFRDYGETEYQYAGIHAYEKLNDLGYDQLPTCSTWANETNPEETLRHCKKVISPELLKGYMTAAWATTSREEEYALKNDAVRLWYGRKRVYPETLEK